jgi:HAD superfamily hydrolase (TIGR01509 family)
MNPNLAMKIRLAIFDFDGTLFDSMFVWEEAGKNFLESLGKEPKPNTQEAIRTMSMAQSAQYIKAEYGLDMSPEEIIAGIDKTLENCYVNLVQPKPGIPQLLQELKACGVSICIATATDRYLIEAALKRCGLPGYFDAIFTCDEVGAGKDNPLIFRKALEHFGEGRNTTVIFEDSLHAAKTAKADNFKVAAVYDKSEKEQDELKKIADFYIQSFEDIKWLQDCFNS